MENDEYEWGIYVKFTGRGETYEVMLTEQEESEVSISDEEKKKCNVDGGYYETKMNDHPYYIEIAWRQMNKIINHLHYSSPPPPNLTKSNMVLIKYVQNVQKCYPY